MKHRITIVLVLVAVIAVPIVLLQVIGERSTPPTEASRAVIPDQLTEDLYLLEPSLEEAIRRGNAQDTIDAVSNQDAQPQPITVDYPENASLFPPDLVAPTFLWHDSAESGAWLITVSFAGFPHSIRVLVPGIRPEPDPLDPTCIQEGGINIYDETEYQASARGWRPEKKLWELIKRHSVDRDAEITIVGIAKPSSINHQPSAISRGQVAIRTSRDPVGAPIFYRSVPLRDTSNATALRTTTTIIPLIEWKLRDVSRPRPRLLLKDMPTCANCHSFSQDGSTMGMDVDGPGGDKGMYTVSQVKELLEINTENVFTWSDFKHGEKPDGFKIFGFLSRISPDGQHVVSTVNEALFMGYYPSYKYLQVFFPTIGILGVWSKKTGDLFPLRGADDPDYLQSNGIWSPDGKYVYYIRSKAMAPYVKGAPMPTYPNDPRERQIRYDIYRVPFNNGEGGVAEAVKGASHNEKSNYFPKISPDGKWMVFCKCRNGLLMRPDSDLYIVPAEGGAARKMRCNSDSMDSWHAWSPNGKWLAFSSKRDTPYTQLFLTHIDDDGNDTPAILVPDMNPPNRAVNLPEFVNIPYDGLKKIVVNAVDFQRRIDEGYANMGAGRYDAAGKDFRAAIALRPDATAAHYGYSVYHFVKGDYEACEKELLETLKHEPDNPESRSYVDLVNWDLGEVYSRLGRTEEAEERFIAALDRDFVYPAVGELLENSRGRNGDLGAAEKYLVSILDKHADAPLDRAHAGVCQALGTLYTMQGKETLAEPLFRRGLDAAPTADGYYALGVVLGKQGRSDEALAQYRESVQLNPNGYEARSNLGALLMNKGELDEAVEHLKVAVDIRPTDLNSHFNLGLAMAALGRFAESIEHYLEVVDKDPLDARARMKLAAGYASLGRMANAVEAGEAALVTARKAGSDALARQIEAQLAEHRK
jgi:tetratricopeptide (TPR) repeat protein